MPTIYELPNSLIDQIAAGEVIENPTSVVKELIENALDAQATEIHITLEEGGYNLIRIEDNGSGMSPEDATLSLKRHATSKIRCFEDLHHLSTMGFRGEALASIASICHLEMRTAQKEAVRLVVRGGQLETVEPCARNPGTTLEIRSLFFNVPARKKFQKSPGASQAQILRCIQTLALAHPKVAFSLVCNGHPTLQLPPHSSLQERMETTLGIFPHQVDYESPKLRIEGFLGSIEQARKNRLGQFLFINQRPVFSPLLSRAVKEGYGTRLADPSHPSFVLLIHLPPDQLDVNVHPQKREVRFQDESSFFREVKRAISSSWTQFSFEALEHTKSDSFSFSPPLNTPSFHLEEPSPRDFQSSFALSFAETPLTVVGPFFLLQRDTLLLVDLRRARARLLFDHLNNPSTPCKTLSIPLQWNLKAPPSEELLQDFEKMGCESRFLTENTLAIETLPPFLNPEEFSEFAMLWQIEKNPQSAVKACFQKIDSPYSIEEALSLWNLLQKSSDALYDPLGGLIWKSLEIQDLQKLFQPPRT